MALELPNKDKIAKISMPISGFLFDAPLGTVISEDPNVPLPEGVRALGYLDADAGLVESVNAEDGTDVVALGGDTIGTTDAVKKPQLAFTLLQSESVDALNMGFGPGEVTYDTATEILSITDMGGNPEPRMLVRQTIVNGNRWARKVWPRVEFASRGEEKISNDGFPSYALVYNIRKVAGVNSEYKSTPREPIVVTP